jgi:hypothetical protein
VKSTFSAVDGLGAEEVGARQRDRGAGALEAVPHARDVLGRLVVGAVVERLALGRDAAEDVPHHVAPQLDPHALDGRGVLQVPAALAGAVGADEVVDVFGAQLELALRVELLELALAVGLGLREWFVDLAGHSLGLVDGVEQGRQAGLVDAEGDAGGAEVDELEGAGRTGPAPLELVDRQHEAGEAGAVLRGRELGEQEGELERRGGGGGARLAHVEAPARRADERKPRRAS